MVEMPKNPNFKEAIEDLVLKMPIANFIGMRFTKIELGFVDIVIPYREELSFAKGFFQAGPVGMPRPTTFLIFDSPVEAC